MFEKQLLGPLGGYERLGESLRLESPAAAGRAFEKRFPFLLQVDGEWWERFLALERAGAL